MNATVSLFQTDWFDECHENVCDFPTCEYLLRDNWFLACPLPVEIMHAGVDREQDRIDPELLTGVRTIPLGIEFSSIDAD